MRQIPDSTSVNDGIDMHFGTLPTQVKPMVMMKSDYRVYLYLLVPTGRYVVPTGRVIATVSIKVPAGRVTFDFISALISSQALKVLSGLRLHVVSGSMESVL
ncbi:hypothetical protein Tco_1209609 [Tanacetum coccineum]